MTEWRMAVAVALVLAAAVMGAPTIPDLRHVHAEAIRDGGLCRHAAVAVYDRATRAGLPAHILWYRTRGGRYPRHALPLVYVQSDGAWHAIDSGRSPADGETVPRSRRLDRLERISDAGWVSNIGGKVLREFIGYVDPLTLAGWRDELRKIQARGDGRGTSTER
jgi:hypothetical protein